LNKSGIQATPTVLKGGATRAEVREGAVHIPECKAPEEYSTLKQEYFDLRGAIHEWAQEEMPARKDAVLHGWGAWPAWQVIMHMANHTTHHLGQILGATDSELHVGVVDDRPSQQNTAVALRVRLWAEHLRLSQWDAATRADLVDLSRGLSIFNSNWGAPVRFTHPNSRLVEAKP
jgi:hypothetical protein